MIPESSLPIQAELLEDFHAECDELLTTLRTQLAGLEQNLGAGGDDKTALEPLYRAFHSLKGNAAIVGLRTAEELAHAAEGLMRRLSRNELLLTSDHLDLLAACIHRLEQTLTAFRLAQAMPATHDLLALLERISGEPDAVADTSSVIAERADRVSHASWFCTFTPSADLHARGVSIDSVRARLAALGPIASTVPSIRPGGVIAFEFALTPREDPVDLPGWERDGLRWRRAIPAAAAAPLLQPSILAPSRIVRVDLSRLDDLMRITGEMVISRSRLSARIATGNRAELHEVDIALGRSLRELRESITRVRLVSVAEIFSRLPFVVRDLARESGKRVRLSLEGQQTEIDKYLVERLKEPLLHLVRNAVSHGVEAPADRVARAKPPEATILLRARAEGQAVTIQVRDDGAGVDRAAVFAHARAAGLLVPPSPTDRDLLDLICRQGFSTRVAADRAAGRGVGMAVVQNTVRELGGSLSLESAPGQWTQFTLRLPLTLLIAETFIVRAADQTCAVPQGSVEEIIQVTEADIRSVQSAQVVSYRDGVLPLIRLRSLFGSPPAPSLQSPVLVLTSDRGLTGLIVDRVEGQREVVVRTMQDPLIQVPGFSGATELGDGRPVLILDPTAITAGAFRPHATARELILQRKIP